MDRIKKIREAEKQSHTEIYTKSTLFEEGSWLRKPISTVLDLLPFFETYTSMNVLDLGSGIGRNCIPIAQKYSHIDCHIDCVDILDIAIKQLYSYSRQYGVSDQINGILMPLEDYCIPQNYYDLILAVSSLEHINTENSFWDMLQKIKNGVREHGIVCLIINSNVTETEKVSGITCDAQFEVNLPTDVLTEQLKNIFSDWKIIKFTTVRQEYDIPRDVLMHLTTDVVTWVVQK